MVVRTTTAATLARVSFLAFVSSGLLSSVSAHATAIQSQSFNTTDTITVKPSDGEKSHTAKSFGALTFNQFDTTQGVLTAVQVVLTSTRSQTTVVSGTPPAGTGAKKNDAENGMENVHFTAPGINGGISAISQSGTCGTGGGALSCPRTTGPVGTTTNKTYAGTPSSYAGTGTFGVALKGDVKAQDNTSGSGTWTNPSNAYTVGWSGTVDVKYSYQQHANASFNANSADHNVLNLNFGTIAKDNGSGTLLFKIFDLLANDPNADGRLGLTYDSAISNASGDTAAFAISGPFSGINDLAAGQGKSFGVKLDTSKTGKFSATYLLDFDDAQDVTGVGFGSNLLTLNITGEVVPEPATLALAGAAFLMLGWYAVRRRTERA